MGIFDIAAIETFRYPGKSFRSDSRAMKFEFPKVKSGGMLPSEAVRRVDPAS